MAKELKLDITNRPQEYKRTPAQEKILEEKQRKVGNFVQRIRERQTKAQKRGVEWS